MLSIQSIFCDSSRKIFLTQMSEQVLLYLKPFHGFPLQRNEIQFT